MLMKVRVLAVLVVSSGLFAQALSPGVRAGVFLTPLLTAAGPQQISVSPFTIGPCLEVRLWRGAAAGIDFLFRRTGVALSATASPRAEIQQWELPVTVSYRFRRPARPFVRAGISFNRVFDVGAEVCAQGRFGEQFYCSDGGLLLELRHRGTHGVVVGGGLRLRSSRVWIEPELRVTHWVDRNFGVRDSAVRSGLNQIGFLVGVIF